MGRPLRARAPPPEEAGGLILDAVRVTAVVVAHDGDAHLPSTLAAIARQTRPADAVLGVDTGSRDDSVDLMQDALGAEHVASVRASGGFGGAVARGLGELEGDGAASAGEWLWLLHDDSAPAPDALAVLLEAVEAAPRVAVAGCKQLDADAPGRLLDVGLSVSRWGERLTLIDVDEQDQGQYDAKSDVFAVNSAGMLIRRDVWDRLGGFDAALPATGDDVDFCWRARLAGHRVVVVPAARILHTVRPDAAGTPFAARRAEVYSRLKHAPLWALPFHALGALLGGLWQFALGIVVKEPRLGAARLGASLAALAMVGSLARGRRVASRTRAVSRSVVMVPPLVTPRAEVWAHRRALLESAAAESDSVVGDGTGSADGPSEPTGDSQHDFAALAVSSRGWTGTGAAVMAAMALVAGLVALAPLLGAEAAVGGALAPVSSGISAVFAHATSWWTALGAGQPGHGDPFDLVVWVLGILGLGDANRAVVVALVLAAPVAGLGAWALAASLTAHRAPRTLAALVWAAAPSLIVALGQGRLGAVIAHAALPWAALGMLRAVGGARIRGAPGHEPRAGSGGVPSWTAAAAGGLALACATAGAPSLVPLAAAVVLVLTLVLRGRARTLWWVLVPTVAIFLPLWVSAPGNLRAWIADPGVPLPAAPAAPWQLVLGQPVAFDAATGLTGVPFLPAGVPWSLLAAILVGAPVLGAAVAGAVLLTGRRGAAARLLLALGIGALAYAWAVSRVPTAVAGDALATPFAGPSLGAGCLAFLGVAVLAGDWLIERRRAAAHRGGAARTAAAAAALAAVLIAAGPVGVLVQWATTGLTHPQSSGGLGPEALVAPGKARVLPATAADLGLGPQQTRTLVLRATDAGGFTASLMRGSGTTLDALSAIASSRRIAGEWGAERIAADDGALAAMRRAVATVGGGAAVDPRADLEQLGVGFVVLADTSAADQLTASRIDSVPSLVAVGRTDAGWLWRVTPTTAAPDAGFAIDQRVRIVDASGRTLQPVPSGAEGLSSALPAGPEGRRLVLSERVDAGWQATLDGMPLRPTSQDWAQAFELPAQGGQLEVRYANPAAFPLGVLTVAALAVTALLAIPATARRSRPGTPGRVASALLTSEAQRRGPKQRDAQRRRPKRRRRSRAEAGASPRPDGPGPDAPGADHAPSSAGPSRGEEPAHDEAHV